MAPYLEFMAALVQITAWTLDPESIEFLRNVPKSGGKKKNKKNKNEAAKLPLEIESVNNLKEAFKAISE